MPPYRNQLYPPVPKMVVDESRDPLFLKKSDINIKKALQNNSVRQNQDKFTDNLKSNANNFKQGSE